MDKAAVIVVIRNLSPGFAERPSPAVADGKTIMLFATVMKWYIPS